MMHSFTRRRAGSIGIAMTLALSITAPTGAEEGTLCEALSLEDVSGIADLPWELYFEDAATCVYGEPEGHPFSHRVTVQYDQAGYTFDGLMAEEGSREVAVGDHRGVSVTGGAVWVWVGDEVLLVFGNFTDPDVQSRVDIDEFVIDVARSTVADLPEDGGPGARSPDGAGEDVVDAEAAGLPQLDAIEWDVVLDLQGAEVIEDQAEPYRSLWQAVLGTLGAEADGMSEISAKARSVPGGEELGQYTRIDVPGAGGAALRPVIEEQYRALLGPDLVIDDVGDGVSKWSIPDQPPVYAYYAGDSFHLFLGPEDILELIIAELR